MPRLSCRLLCLGLIAAVLVAGPAWIAQAADFRIESKVTLGKNTVSENLTLFHNDTVYDFLADPPEITVFDPHPARARFVLLDASRQVQTEVKLADVSAFMVRLRQQAQESEHPFMKFLADPKFEEKFDSATGSMSLASPWMVYQLNTAKAPSNEIVEQYHEFSNWYARLNTMTTVGRIPPFPRMVVNARLKQYSRLPLEVKLALHLEESVELQSDHKVHFKLLDTDLKKIRQVDNYVVKFKTLPLRDYFGIEQQQAAGKQPDRR